jgi:DivIVA domain-containing protein
MMDLTPLDVRKKKEDLRRSVRGYDVGQVDSFLDLVAERMEQLVQSELRLSEQVEVLREQLAAFQERERALNEALVTAQELREEARAQAEKAADLRLREAEQAAADVTKSAERAVDDSRRALNELKTRRSGFLRALRTTLERFLDEVEQEQQALAGESLESLAKPAGSAGEEGYEASEASAGAERKGHRAGGEDGGADAATSGEAETAGV